MIKCQLRINQNILCSLFRFIYVIFTFNFKCEEIKKKMKKKNSSETFNECLMMWINADKYIENFLINNINEKFNQIMKI